MGNKLRIVSLGLQITANVYLYIWDLYALKNRRVLTQRRDTQGMLTLTTCGICAWALYTL